MSTFYICPTPIGNLKDISERILNTLDSVDIIYCEGHKKSKKAY
jgi:16S rRNA (cytidine1402-2'-O)-methyltransferase